MNHFRNFRQLITWLAIVLILGSAVAPTISHALTPQMQVTVGLSEICSDHEQELSLALDDAEENHSEHQSLHFEHCPFCVHHTAEMLLDQEFCFLFPAAQSALYPLLFFSSLRPLFAWSVANPRAPPVFA